MATVVAAEAAPCSAIAPAVPKSHLKARYELLETNIGEGTYGKVHKARDLKTGQIVAIKKAKVTAADRNVGGIGFTALREIKLMQAVKHKNVMSCLDVFSEDGALHLVMEFMDKDLRNVIEDKSVSLSEAHVKCLARQVLDGLAAMHMRWFAHRDVAPANVLINFATGEAKLSDFGFTRTIGHRNRPLTPMCTTIWYRAPELLYGAKYYGLSVDIWSFGCVLAELFLRKPMFWGRGEFDMLTKIFEKRGTPTNETWENVSALPSFVQFSQHPAVPMGTLLPSATPSALALLEEGLLQLDPKKRLTAEQARQHDFFSNSLPRACDPQDLPVVHKDGQLVGEATFARMPRRLTAEPGQKVSA